MGVVYKAGAPHLSVALFSSFCQTTLRKTRKHSWRLTLLCRRNGTKMMTSTTDPGHTPGRQRQNIAIKAGVASNY
jgi:hypothetical protein